MCIAGSYYLKIVTHSCFEKGCLPKTQKRPRQCREVLWVMVVLGCLKKKFKVAPYSFTIARALMAKAQVICARSKENVSVFRYFMTSK